MTSHLPAGAQEPPRPETFREELAEALAPRTLLLTVGVGLLCIGFALS
ncbi:hypothetical protein [Actinokineospora bangkokensis]|nr:hypothetical protein [Actinokineospora bangkokensis]